MRKKHNELAMGVTVTIVAAGIVVGILYLQQPGILATGERVRMMIDHVESLARGDEVRFRGVRVGTVQSIDFVKAGLMVNLQIDPGVQIPKDSQFFVSGAGILSGASVVIQPGTSNQSLPQNAVVQGKTESGLLTFLQNDSGVQTKIEGVLTDAQKFLQQIQQFPQQQIGTQIQDVLVSLSQTVDHLNGVISEDRKTVSSILGNVDNVVKTNQGGISDAVTKLNTDVQAFQTSLGKLDQTLNEARSAIGQIDVLVTSLNSGDGTAGKLLTDNTLYHKLNDTLDSINALAKDIKENPKKYVQVRVF